MKRTKFLALALVVAVMLMGAGYAYWQEELTITNTVDTGDLNVIFQEPEETTEAMYTGQNVSTIQNDPHKLKVELIDVYPGAEFKLYFNLENIGTLAAYVDDFKVKAKGANVTRANQILCNKIEIKDNDGPSNNGFETITTTGCTLSQALNKLNESDGNRGIYLDSKERRDKNTLEAVKKEVKFYLQINPNATEKQLPQDVDNITFGVTAQVHQYNNEARLPQQP